MGAVRCYRLALRVYPRAFRARFGREMEATFTASYVAARQRGGGAVALLCLRTVVEVIGCAVFEWAQRLKLRRRRPSSRERSFESATSLLRDLRIGMRTLLRRPSFTWPALLTLGLGIGLNTAVFSVVHGVLWRPLSYERPDDLVMLWPERAFSTREVVYLRNNTTTLRGMATVASWTVALTDVEEPTQLSAARTSANLFSLLGVAPMLGRTFHDDDVAVGANPVAMLSHDIWRARFGADTSLIGRTITIDGEPHRVVGVMPESFEVFSPATQLWIPLVENPEHWQYSGNFSQTIARMGPNVTLAVAEAEFLRLVVGMRESLGYPDDFGSGARMVGLKDQLVGRYQGMFLVLLSAVGFILLIAGSNLSSLLLAKAADRRREMAMRAALGATRGDLMRVVLAESGVLSLAGGLVGLSLAFGGVVMIKAILPAGMPRVAAIAVDGPVLVMCFAFALATGLLFSVAPAAAVTRVDLQREVGGVRTPGQKGIGGFGLRSGFVVLQVALAVMLVVGAGLMVRTIGEFAAVRPGFDYDSVVTLRLYPVGSHYDSPAKYRRYYLDLVDRLEAIPGVDAAGAAQHLPLSGWGWNALVDIEGHVVADGQSRPRAGWRIVTGHYFKAMGIRLLEGRVFDPTDAEETPPVAVVSRTFARRFWPDGSPVGKRFRQGRDSDEWVTVVGVVGDVMHYSLVQDPEPVLYRPHLQSTMPALMIAVRTAGEPGRMAAQVRSEVWALDPDVPLSGLMPMDQLVSASYSDSRLVMLLLTVFAAVALALGAVGVYGVTSFAVSRRTNEIGLKMALGASGRRVLGEVLRLGLMNALAGTVLGLAGAFGLARFIEGLVFGVSATDPATFAGVAGFILLVALGASCVPAWRAARIDPADALRAV